MSIPAKIVLAAVALAAALLASAPPADAGGTCVSVINRQGSESLVNACNKCISVSVIRSRAGYGAPTQRSFTLRPASTFPLPFKGRGSTRLSAEEPCEGEVGASQNLVQKGTAAPALEQAQCIGLYRTAKGVVMLNECEDCRVAVVERSIGGAGAKRASYPLAANGQAPLDPLGATSARIVGELACQ